MHTAAFTTMDDAGIDDVEIDVEGIDDIVARLCVVCFNRSKRSSGVLSCVICSCTNKEKHAGNYGKYYSRT